MTGRSGKHNRRKIKINCPDIVQDIKEQHLYIIVAFWGMRTGRLLTPEAVSREFFIPQKIAKDILHYIDHEGRIHISSRRFIQNNQANGRIFALKILDVLPPPEMPVSTRIKLDFLPEAAVTPVKRPPAPPTKFQKLRQWMLSRKHNEQVPPEFLGDG
ncbi:hypothetical protein [Atlantibacter hermannii]|uniref:hypothetical protein n=1 Tax=Atlantibacter hermannii TaxID=565 RepID=UPI002541168B|nr:hypothetical protein [Atlantibacter hermannii]WIF57212.1 hypothetical protein QN094_14520 [Atlantibacter hermannii]